LSEVDETAQAPQPKPATKQAPKPTTQPNQATKPKPALQRQPEPGIAGPDESRNPWQPVGVDVRYENPWIRVEHHDVIRPDGGAGIYGVVRFRNAAVGVVALDDDGRCLLVGQWRYTLNRYSWEIPEGGVPLGASLLDGAQRELAEETGFAATTWREISRFALSNSVTDEEGALFVAEGLVAGEAAPEPTEELAVRWVALADAVAMIDRGEITDGMSQIAILRVALEHVAAERAAAEHPGG
jgi:8-oxo-dGTP pyrophosphatase MutT (NUDIX family)